MKTIEIKGSLTNLMSRRTTYLDLFKHTTPNHNTTTISIIILTAQPIIKPRSAELFKPGRIQRNNKIVEITLQQRVTH